MKRRSRLTGKVREAFDEALEWAGVSAEVGRIETATGLATGVPHIGRSRNAA
jgi:hypothetical protein